MLRLPFDVPTLPVIGDITHPPLLPVGLHSREQDELLRVKVMVRILKRIKVASCGDGVNTDKDWTKWKRKYR